MSRRRTAGFQPAAHKCGLEGRDTAAWKAAVRVAAALALAALAWAPAAAAAERSAALAAMLGKVPAILALAGPAPEILFQDFRAAAEAARRGAPPPAAEGGRPPLPRHYTRLLASAFAEAMRAGIEGEWQPRIGFGPESIETLLVLARPPAELVLLDLVDEIDHAGIGAVLLANGYARRDLRPGWSAFVRGGEDFSIDFGKRDPADPFGGDLGRAARVASDGSLIVYSTAWPLIETVAAGAGPSLAEDRPLRAVLAALDDPRFGAAKLVQATILAEPWPAYDPLTLRPGAPPPEPGVGLARWQIGVIADLSTGAEDIAVAAVAYPSRGLAEAMAARLAANWESAAPPSQPHLTFAELVEGTADIFVVGEGPTALVLSVRRDMRGDPDVPSNLPFRRLVSSWVSRDLVVFAAD